MNASSGRTDESGRERSVALGGVFAAAYVLAALSMTLWLGLHDEGLVLTGAMRVNAGQVVHRDFYSNYGPAQFYLVAGLFRVFGASVLVERMLDLGFKAGLVTAVFAVLRPYCTRAVALWCSLGMLLWCFACAGVTGTAIVPVTLLCVVGGLLLLPVFTGSVSRGRMAAAGVVAGVTTLFRYDVGVALLGLMLCSMGVATVLRLQEKRGREFWRVALPCVLGFMVVVLPVVAGYLAVAPASDFLHDIVRYPAQAYHAGRNLPFPRPGRKTITLMVVYAPWPVLAVAAWMCVLLGRRREGDEGAGTARQGVMIVFTLLGGMLYAKGLVRLSPVQMFASAPPCCVLVGMLVGSRSLVTRGVRRVIVLVAGVAVLATLVAVRGEYYLMKPLHASLPARWMEEARHEVPAVRAGWCAERNPLTRGVCFLSEDERMLAIEYLRAHTHAGDTLFEAVGHNDRVFAVDNLMYAGAELLPATKWSQFDPLLQNAEPVQREIVGELERNRPPYVVRDSEFDAVHEPNDSDKSTGVEVLDEYLEQAYQPEVSFGSFAIWRRRGGVR